MGEKPLCKLIGEDSNVFNLIGLVNRTLRDAGQRKEAEEFRDRAFKAKSYDEVLAMLDDYVVVE